jgi:hypothetical protein
MEFAVARAQQVEPSPAADEEQAASGHPPAVQAFSLLELTQEERDHLLGTIVYVEEPKTYECFHIPISEQVFNYSKFYESLSEQARTKVPRLSGLRTGDMLKLHDYRGCGTRYVMWLHRDLDPYWEKIDSPYELSSDRLHAELLTLPDYPSDSDVMFPSLRERFPLPPGGWDQVDAVMASDNWNEHPDFLQMQAQFPDLFGKLLSDKDLQRHVRNRALAKHNKRFPSLAPRQSDGAHNDGLHHCYLFDHPDEYGYCSSTAVSSADEMYFHREYASALVDPLFTHSLSFYGKLISECKMQPERSLDPLFPLHYIGNCDRFRGYGRFSADMIEWTAVDSLDDEHDYHVRNTRAVLTKHFEVVFNNDDCSYILK